MASHEATKTQRVNDDDEFHFPLRPKAATGKETGRTCDAPVLSSPPEAAQIVAAGTSTLAGLKAAGLYPARSEAIRPAGKNEELEYLRPFPQKCEMSCPHHDMFTRHAYGLHLQ